MIIGVNHTSFTVSDVERSVAFYQDLLGMELLSLAGRDPAFSERVTGVPGAHLKVAYLKTLSFKASWPFRMNEERVALHIFARVS